MKAALEGAGFVYAQLLDVDMFRDGESGKPSEAVHLLYANEPVKPEYPIRSPDVSESERAAEFQVISLEGLVRMKLVAFRRKDQMHLMDLIGVGLIDASWPARYPSPLSERLQELLDDPNG